ncbi:hypothetical protein GQ600_16951 [Phytophthora cactorum]|nr:hypothetical protein GQ600_16951 [Phytophthora cactorum]
MSTSPSTPIRGALRLHATGVRLHSFTKWETNILREDECETTGLRGGEHFAPHGSGRNCFFKPLGDLSFKRHLAPPPPSPPPLDVRHVIDLRKGLYVPETAFYGSNASQMRVLHALFGMLKCFGSMQVFITVSPASEGTYSIAIKLGRVTSDN